MTDPASIAAKLTDAQREMLCRVCATNGGGLSGYDERRSTAKALYDRDLVQGKAGQQWRIVHTKLGLAVRAILERQSHEG